MRQPDNRCQASHRAWLRTPIFGTPGRRIHKGLPGTLTARIGDKVRTVLTPALQLSAACIANYDKFFATKSQLTMFQNALTYLARSLR